MPTGMKTNWNIATPVLIYGTLTLIVYQFSISVGHDREHALKPHLPDAMDIEIARIDAEQGAQMSSALWGSRAHGAKRCLSVSRNRAMIGYP
jgi:hypothetical protein